MKNRIVVFLLTFCFCGSLFAQPITVSSRDKMLSTAEEQEELQNFYSALEWYEKAYEDEKTLDLAYKIAVLSMELRDYRSAERSYKRIVRKRNTRKRPNTFMPDIRIPYAQVLKINEKYEDAKEQLLLYIAEGEDPDKIKQAKDELAGVEYAMEMDVLPGVTVEHGGKKMNSKYSEYSPVMIGNQMFFTGIRSNEIVEMDDKGKDKAFSKVFVSTKGDKGYGEPTQVGEDNISREGFHIGNMTMTKDGRKMYFTRALLDGNILSESKLYVSEKSGEGWNPAKEVEGINGDYIVSQPAMGELFGREVLYFASDMDGGYGGFDLYYATRTGDGFAPPVNLGDVVNTIADEETPYYVDGTLYFSSTGHTGIGGFDIFESTWNGTNWSEPANMGKPYNSSVDDLYFTIDADRLNGALVSNRDGTRSVRSKTCCNDIFIVSKEEVVLDLLAKVSADGKPLTGATMKLVEVVNTDNNLVDSRTKPKSSDFSFPLEKEKAYKIVVTREGYYPDSTEFNTVGLEQSTTIEKMVSLKALPPPPPPEPEVEVSVEEPIRLSNIYYDLDDDKILPDAEKDLSYIKELMETYADMVIELSSHTDSQGGSIYNKKLSQRRAESAKNWLVERGVAEERIQAVGYGERKILNQCTNGVQCTDEEHRFNRRTEFQIISGPTTIKVKKSLIKKKETGE